MDDAEIKRLREEQVKWTETLGQAEDVKDRGETLLMTRPNNILIRFLVWAINWCHRKLADGEEKARDAARKTYDL